EIRAARRQRLPRRRRKSASADPLRRQQTRRAGEGRGLRCGHPAAVRAGRGRAHRRARCRRREARPDGRNVRSGRPRPADAGQMRLRPQPPAQPRQGLSTAAPLRRVGPNARASRADAVSGHAEVLRGADEVSRRRLADLPACRLAQVSAHESKLGPPGMTALTPTTAEEVREVVAWAAGEGAPLEVLGHGTKRDIGRPIQSEHALDLSRLGGITLYEPNELVLGARAGTPVAEIEALLGEHGQQLAFEPMDYRPLLGGGNASGGTLGGVVAANVSGPRRLKAGAARDHILGIHAVSGRGEAFKSGGRVVKNVTGYDLSKGLAGSWGTLAVVTDVTFKVLPAAETETTLAVRGLYDEQAVAAMSLAMGSSAEVSSAAHLPYPAVARVNGGRFGSDSATLLRVEGFAPSVAARLDMLKTLLRNAGPLEEIDSDRSRTLWAEVRDCTPFAGGDERPVWRVSMAPSNCHGMVMALRQQCAVDAFYDWQGGLAWLRMESGDPEAELVRALVRKHGGGHALLVRATVAHRSSLPVFQPQPPALAALSGRLKEQFDPMNILNPGRMA